MNWHEVRDGTSDPRITGHRTGGRRARAARGRRRRPPGRAGISLLEVLIAIGIIAVLAAIAVYGLGSMMASNKRRLTQQTLANGRGVLREYERATQMKRIPTDPVAAPGLVTEGAADRNGDAVKKTREMMALVRGIPANQAALNQLPPSSVQQGSTPAEGPLLIDGWGNPILFVPAGGLGGVKTAAGADQTVRSPDGKPFFAAAGPDGSFAAGKDNLYSFDN